MFTITPQFWSIVITTILTVVVSLILYYVVIKKQDPLKEPKGIMVLIEGYVVGFNKLMESMTGGKLKAAYPYFFTLLNFLIINELIVWFGWESPATSIMFTFTLGMITFIGIYVVGVGTKGLINFCKHKYANPIELFSQFSPLISISVRLFGATFAGAVIGDILFIVVQGMLPAGDHFVLTFWPVMGGFTSWIWQIMDSGLSLIQAFVFTVLTAVYWSMECGDSWSPKKRRELAKQKKILLDRQKEKRLAAKKAKTKVKLANKQAAKIKANANLTKKPAVAEGKPKKELVLSKQPNSK